MYIQGIGDIFKLVQTTQQVIAAGRMRHMKNPVLWAQDICIRTLCDWMNESPTCQVIAELFPQYTPDQHHSIYHLVWRMQRILDSPTPEYESS
jgi:hypothetical protein